jgi:hypothetical protein
MLYLPTRSISAESQRSIAKILSSPKRWELGKKLEVRRTNEGLVLVNLLEVRVPNVCVDAIAYVDWARETDAGSDV